MTAALKELLRNTLNDLSGVDFKTFKHYLRDKGQIKWGKLEKADTNDVVDLMVETYTMGTGCVMMTILQKINHNQLARDLERDLAELGGEQYYSGLAGGGGGTNVDAAVHSEGVEQSVRKKKKRKKKKKKTAQEQNVTMPEKNGAVTQERIDEALLVEDPQCSAVSLAVPEPQQGEGVAQPVIKSPLKQKLQEHIKKRFSVIHQESGFCIVKDVYTELHVVKGRTGGVNCEHEVATIDMSQLGARPSSEDEQVKLANILTDSASKVLTLGIAGVGKTVAVQKFVMDWAEDTSNQDIDFVFVILFRELNLKKKQCFNLLGLLLLFYPNLKDLKKITESDECKILLVFDGLDECRLQLDFKKWTSETDKEFPVEILITSLIKGMLLPSALIWVTTRPAAASLIPDDLFNLVTEVRGFNNDQIIEFFEKNIKDTEKAKHLTDHIKKNRSLHIMCHIPVFCRIITSVKDEILRNESKGEGAKTLTEMYAMYSVSQIKTMNEKYKDKKMSAKEKGQLLVKLGKLAFKHLEKGTLIFYEKDLTECGIDVTSGALRAGLCTQIFNVASATTGEELFSFVHLSVQEFLAALYVLKKNATHWTNRPLVNTLKEKYSRLSKHSRVNLYTSAVDEALQSPNGHLDLFVRFLLGLAPMVEPKIQSPLDLILPWLYVREESISKTVQHIKVKIRENISSERIINLFHCLNELGDNTLVDEIKRYINSAEEKNLTPAQCSALAYIQLMSTENFEEFDLKKHLRSDEGLRRMLPVVKVSRRVWLNRCNLSETSCKNMASVLQRTPSYLRELDMSENDLQDEGVKLLCVGLEDPQCKVKTLRLNRCDISETSCKNIASVLQRTPSHLRELDMSDNDLQDEGVELLSVGLKHPQCKLETLRLNRCNLSETSCESMASVLQSTPSSLRELDMSDNDLQDEGVDLLCVGLKDPQCKLETLRLSGCLINQKGCSSLSSVLKSNPSYLKQLDLNYNDPGHSGVRELTVRLNDPSCKLEVFRHDHGGQFRIKPGLKKYACELTLDPNTAHRELSFSKGNRKVTRVSEKQPYPDHPERFDYCPQVLCREGLTGRCYWEAEWISGRLEIAVAYKSTPRKQSEDSSSSSSSFGYNAKSWKLFCSKNKISAFHNNEKTAIPFRYIFSNRIGVYLDWSAGTLSFYIVSTDRLTHLHTFHSTFTEPLYPGFGFWTGSSVSLCRIT